MLVIIILMGGGKLVRAEKALRTGPATSVDGGDNEAMKRVDSCLSSNNTLSLW